MRDEAIAFWKKRRPDHAPMMEHLNKLGPHGGSWLFD
jgi:hypothetical protein